VDAPDEREPSEVHTPGQKTIADIAAFLKVPATHQIKSLVYIAEGRPYLFLLRGDHQLSAAKAISATGEAQARPALPEEIRSAFGADPGSLGPTGVTAIPVFADLALKGRRNLTCGANRNDYHLQGVTPDVHFQPFWADLRIVEQGDACLQCGRPLDVSPGVLVARVTERDSQAAGGSIVMILSAEGKQVPARVASSRIYLERIMALAVELHHDADGIIWPPTIAPFAVIITPVNYKNEVKMAADQLYEDLRTAGIDTLLDDRAERPGVKFKDADLTGIPYRIVIGPEKIKQGIVELFDRAARTTEVLDLTAIVRRMAG
jgi:prolyl-tRNA synthetase